jgi:hypothetical protein
MKTSGVYFSLFFPFIAGRISCAHWTKVKALALVYPDTFEASVKR